MLYKSALSLLTHLITCSFITVESRGTWPVLQRLQRTLLSFVLGNACLSYTPVSESLSESATSEPLAIDMFSRHWLMPISCHFQDCKALLFTSLLM